METPTISEISPTTNQAIRCKLAFNGELCCCMLASPPSMPALQDTVARLFNIGPAVGRPFTLQYFDEEGDAVSFATTQELHDASQASLAVGAYLKLHVQLNDTCDSSHDDNIQPTDQLSAIPRRGSRHGGKPAFHHFAPGEMNSLLSELESRGFGQRQKRNARLLRKMGGNVDAVIAVLREADAAASQRRLARQQRKLASPDGRPGGRDEKKARRAKHDPTVEGFISLAEGWPAGVNALYLDGNNMVFLTAALRRHTLGRGQRWRAEAILSSLAESFARAKASTGLQNTVMIYDFISSRRCGVKTIEGGSRFTVASARPEFSTSDDALVAWAKALPPAQAKASLFVTSDRELKDRLLAVGALVAKPKQWVELARRTLEGRTEEEANTKTENEASLDDFLEEWSKKLVLAGDPIEDEVAPVHGSPFQNAEGDEMVIQ